MNLTNLKIVVYVPTTHANQIREALAQAGAGNIGNYDYCSFSTTGTGRFRPQAGANPHVGNLNQIEEVAEERIETIAPKEKLPQIITAIKAAHPYEEPAIDVYPLLDV